LVRAWWDDSGCAGRCPGCGGWIHFTIRGKRAIDENENRMVPQLPANWTDEAVILYRRGPKHERFALAAACRCAV
jgi:hypothetical protein